MDVSHRAFRELRRNFEKVRKIIGDSPINRSLLSAQDNLTICIEAVENKTRTLLLLAESEKEISLLRDLLDKNSIKEFQIKSQNIVTKPSNDQSLPEVFVSFQVPPDEELRVKLDFHACSSFVIGRNERKSNLLIDRCLTLISGVHAEICFDSNSKLSLRDLGSLNGTYVNRIKCEPNKWIDISNKDQVVFGGAYSVPGTGTLLFETDGYGVKPESNEQTVSLAVTTGLLLLPNDDVESAVQCVETAVETSSASTLIVLLNRSATQSTEKQLTRLGEKLSSTKNSIYFFPVYLSPYVASNGFTLLIPEAQKEYESLIAQMRSSFDEQFLLSSMLNSLTRIVGQICKLYELAINANMLESSRNMSSSGVGQHGKEQAASDKSAYHLITRYEGLIQVLKNSLAAKKEEFLDDYSVQSMTRSIDQELSTLSQSRKQADGLIRISLEPPVTNASSDTLHKHMLSFCHNLLSEWSNSVLESVLDNSESSDSVSRLYLEASYAYQVDDKSGSYSKSNSRPELELNINEILNAKIAPPVTYTLIRFPGFLGYIFKNLRGQIMSIGGTIVIVGGMLTSQIRDGLKEIVLPALLPVIGVLTWLAYSREMNQKSDEAIDKLKKDARTYYVAYTKSRIEKVTVALVDLLTKDKELFRNKLLTTLQELDPNCEQNSANKESADETGSLSQDLSRADLSKMNRQLESLNKLVDELERSSE